MEPEANYAFPARALNVYDKKSQESIGYSLILIGPHRSEYRGITCLIPVILIGQMRTNIDPYQSVSVRIYQFLYIYVRIGPVCPHRAVSVRICANHIAT